MFSSPFIPNVGTGVNMIFAIPFRQGARLSSINLFISKPLVAANTFCMFNIKTVSNQNILFIISLP